MKIRIQDIKKTQDALNRAHGKASAHVFTARDLQKIERDVVQNLRQYLTLAEIKGTTGTSQSGDKLPNSYRHPRTISIVTWEINGKGEMFLTGVRTTQAGGDAGQTIVGLTGTQREIIARKAVESVSRL